MHETGEHRLAPRWCSEVFLLIMGLVMLLNAMRWRRSAEREGG
jgi:hypothetical protein